MDTFTSAMVQDVGVLATGVLQSIGKDGHSIKCFFFIDALSESENG
jgi:hypothetical protein